MKEHIENRIDELREYVDKQRELIIGINDAIENDNYVPSPAQQATIEYICNQGQTFLKEISRLEKLKKSL